MLPGRRATARAPGVGRAREGDPAADRALAAGGGRPRRAGRRASRAAGADGRLRRDRGGRRDAHGGDHRRLRGAGAGGAGAAAPGRAPGDAAELTPVAAVSVGLVAFADGSPIPVLDLPYVEDSRAAVDLNVVMLAGGGLVEVQGTGSAAASRGRSSTRCSGWRSRASASCCRSSRRRWRGRRRETAGAGDGEPHKVGSWRRCWRRRGGDRRGGGAEGTGAVIVEDQDSFVAHAALKAHGIGRLAGRARRAGRHAGAGRRLGGLRRRAGRRAGGRLGGVRGAAGGRRGQQRPDDRGAGGARARSLGVPLRVRAGAARVDGAAGAARRATAGPGPGLVLFTARWHGEIRRERRGTGGFGYDPHVWIPGEAGERTVAELPAPRRPGARIAGRRSRSWSVTWAWGSGPRDTDWSKVRTRRGVAQPGSAPALGAGCRRFESSRPDHAPIAQLDRASAF
jgi:hypothetical protein